MKYKKVPIMLKRLHEVEAALSSVDVQADPQKFRQLAEEHAFLSQVKGLVDLIETLEKKQEENRLHISSETDSAFVEYLKEDSLENEKKLEGAKESLKNLLIPPDPKDSKPAILELRAGAGGDEAALFVADCVRMYQMYANEMGWNWELLSCTESELGGFKEYIMVLTGQNVYRMLRYEGGTHRVQRVPKTEAQGRIHTSTITVAVLLEPDENCDIVIDDKDIRVDTYRASGAGGQHVNKTDSAVRLTHIPTGIQVYSQQERSQHKNRDLAMRLLRAKLSDMEEEKKRKQFAEERLEQVGTGDRSERIRTYNFPQNRVTDHRVNLTTHDLDKVIGGKLEKFSLALIHHFHQGNEEL